MMKVPDPTPAQTRLQQARIERNWRQSDLADKIGTTVVTIRRWERGSHQPSPYYRVKLCALFGMSSQELGLIADAPDEEHQPEFSVTDTPIALLSNSPSALDRPLVLSEKEQGATLPISPTPPALPISPTSSTPQAFRWASQHMWISIVISVVLLALVLGGLLLTIDIRYSHATATISTTPSNGNNRTATSSTALQSTIDPYSSNNTLALSDDLTSNTANSSQWDVSPSGKAHGCFFRNHTYDMSSQGINYCVANNLNVANFVYQIQLKIMQGHAAGIIFRTDDSAAQTYYIFEITEDGTFFVQRNDSSEDDVQLSEGNSTAIKTGFNQPNSLAVDANGGQMTFYINGKLITQLTDDHYSSGLIGVIVGEQTDTQTITEAAYNYARVWI